jgi:hypothetical protein
MSSVLYIKNIIESSKIFFSLRDSSCPVFNSDGGTVEEFQVIVDFAPTEITDRQRADWIRDNDVSQLSKDAILIDIGRGKVDDVVRTVKKL